MLNEPSKDTDALVHLIIDAAMEVHRTLGPGYMESIYEEALAIELKMRGISFERQKQIAVNYKGHNLGEGRLDLLVGNKIIVELKTVETLAPVHKAQLLSYLKTTGHRIGLLINFNVALLKDGIKRVICSKVKS